MILTNEAQKKLEKVIADNKLLSATQIEELKKESANTKKSIIALLNEKQLIDEESLTKALGQANGVQYANLLNFKPEQRILDMFPPDLANSHQAVPIGMMNGRLAVGMIDPTNIQATDFISRRINQPVTPVLVSSTSIKNVLKLYKRDVSQEVTDVMSSVSSVIEQEAAKEAEKQKTQKKDNKLNDIVQDAPITRALKTVMEYAYRQGASDVHFEPRPEGFRIRFRIDGILREVMTMPKAVEPAIVSRVKILSKLKIDEHRIPQDGEFRFTVDDVDIDNRVSISPVIYGEQVVIRLLVKDSGLLTLDKLGFKGNALRLLQSGIQEPQGMTLSTGPTGSGKSTTLYTLINFIKDVKINIVTLEDPVEYKMDGINQIQVNADVGLTFSSGLRSILRQDPDAVMVGEIRDSETADLAVQAALTGHIVLSTLHTNSAAGVLPRLLDMNVEPFLIASTVNTVIGQRLVRRLCEKCAEPYQSTDAETEAIKQNLASVLAKTKADQGKTKDHTGFENLPLLTENAYTLYKAVGCSECSDGFKGRMGIYELFAVDEEMEKLITKDTTTTIIHNQAVKKGMITMVQDGYLKALNGITTLGEVARVASE